LRLFEEVDPSFRRFGSAANHKTRRDDDRSFGTCETVEVPGNGIGIMYKWLFLDLWRTRRPRLAASDPNAQAARLQRDAYSRCRKMLDLSRMHGDRLGCGQGGFRSDWYRYRFRKSRLTIVCLVRRTWVFTTMAMLVHGLYTCQCSGFFPHCIDEGERHLSSLW
jgi:hypothetical protein